MIENAKVVSISKEANYNKALGTRAQVAASNANAKQTKNTGAFSLGNGKKSMRKRGMQLFLKVMVELKMLLS